MCSTDRLKAFGLALALTSSINTKHSTQVMRNEMRAKSIRLQGNLKHVHVQTEATRGSVIAAFVFVAAFTNRDIFEQCTEHLQTGDAEIESRQIRRFPSGSICYGTGVAPLHKGETLRRQAFPANNC